MAGNGGPGIFANGGAPGTTTVMIDRSAVVNNSTGIVAALGGGVIRIGDSTVTGNVTGLDFFDSGQIISYETNKIEGNGTDGAPSSTIAMK